MCSSFVALKKSKAIFAMQLCYSFQVFAVNCGSKNGFCLSLLYSVISNNIYESYLLLFAVVVFVFLSMI